MGQPTRQQIYKDLLLTNMAIRYQPTDLVAERAFPTVPVGLPSGYFPRFKKGAWFRDEASVRGWGDTAKRGGYPIGTGTYACKDVSFGKKVPDEERKYSAGPAISPDIQATAFVTNKVLLRKERIVAAACCLAANWASTDDIEGAWATPSTSTFITNTESGIEAVRKATGRRPNKLVIEAATFAAVKQGADVLARIQYGGGPNDPAKVTAQMLAQLFDLDECLIAGGVYSSEDEQYDGDDFTAASIWETNAGKGAAILLYVPRVASIQEPSAGYLFNTEQRYIRRYREEAPMADIIECHEEFDFQITGNDLGYLMYDTLST